MASALAAIDAGGGAWLRHAYERSTANPVVRPLASGATTLVLGSSTGKRGFDPAVLWPNSYNAAEDGQGIFFVAAYMRNLPAASGLRRILVGLDPDEIVSGYRSANTRHLKRMAPFAIADAKLLRQLAHHDPLIAAKYLSGLYPFRGNVPAVMIEWVAPRRTGNGFAPLTRQMTEAPAWNPSGKTPPPPSAEGLDALRDIVDAARRRNIDLVVAVTPIAGGNRREFDPVYGDVMRAARDILAAPRVCDLTDIRDGEIEAISRDRSLFHDAAHLNGAGARRYTQRIRALVERYCAWTLTR